MELNIRQPNKPRQKKHGKIPKKYREVHTGPDGSDNIVETKESVIAKFKRFRKSLIKTS